MEWFSLAIGVVIGLALAGIGLTGSKILAWIEAKIKAVEAEAASHTAAAAVNTARAAVIKQAAPGGLVNIAAVPAVGPTGH